MRRLLGIYLCLFSWVMHRVAAFHSASPEKRAMHVRITSEGWRTGVGTDLAQAIRLFHRYLGALGMGGREAGEGWERAQKLWERRSRRVRRYLNPYPTVDATCCKGQG